MKIIVIADIVMSLDNAPAIAAVAKGDVFLLAVGLVLSVPLIIFGSQLITKTMGRFPVIVYAGAELIAWTAGDVLAADEHAAGRLTDRID